jgi:hypothetical protein
MDILITSCGSINSRLQGFEFLYGGEVCPINLNKPVQFAARYLREFWKRGRPKRSVKKGQKGKRKKIKKLAGYWTASLAIL